LRQAATEEEVIDARKIQPREMPQLRQTMLDRLPKILPPSITHAVLQETPTAFPDGVAVPEEGAYRDPLHRLQTSVNRYTDWLLRQMRAADLYMVTPEQTRRALHAGRELPGYYLRPEDVPSPIGLILFGDLVYGLTLEDVQMEASVVAIMWGPGQVNGRAGLWITTWGDTRTLVSSPAFLHGEVTEKDRERAVTDMGPLYYHDEGLQPWQPTWVEGKMRHEALRTLFATWIMMKQKIVAERTIRPKKDVNARRPSYLPAPPMSPVRVIDVRPRSHAGHDAPREQKVELEYRTAVSPHWRLYHTGPGRLVPRLNFIDEHHRGPEDAPVRPRREVVKVLRK
jgi:hypothetical protein